jgi:hypothetical protein
MISQLTTLTKTEYYVRLAVILFAIVTPFIFLLTQGYLPSISSYWRTPLQPLFIIANASTSYFLFGAHNTWKIPAVFLLLLTAFSIDSYPMVHNVLAVLFFLSALVPLYKTNHFKKFFWLYLTTIFFMPISLTLGEILAVIIMCTYHALLLNKIFRIKKK